MNAAETLERHYLDLQSRYLVTRSGDYQQLVTPNGNGQEPIHRWFHLKEAFSHRLLQRVLKDLELESQPSIGLLDPFIGAGTTPVSAGQLIEQGQLGAVRFDGIETNPFLHLLASTKLRSMQQTVPDFALAAGAVASMAIVGGVTPHQIPGLSTFRDEYFPGDGLEQLMTLRAAIDHVFANSEDDLSRDLARLCLASAIEPASILRKDGRALRTVPGRAVLSPVNTFLATAERICEDLPSRPVDIQGYVDHGDVRQWVRTSGQQGVADLALFSPPYPNNIDYTEVYKMESWLLGFIGSQEEFSAQRRRTLRSHGSLRWEENYEAGQWIGESDLVDLLEPIVRAIPPGRYHIARRQLVLGYADDMASCLNQLRLRLRPGGFVACVVGNSLHGYGDNQFMIASDLIIARLAEAMGLEVKRIEVARVPNRKRTGSEFLRESVVFAQRPRDAVQKRG